ncbi:hypothetical protein DMUE_2994 [Dictyocoela muelleri]|nr:hypothetical protein DMUE_2994 [Dictyocoela muelleri]
MESLSYQLCSSEEEGEIKPNQLKGDRYYHIENFPGENSYLKYLYYEGMYVGNEPLFSKENIIFTSEMAKCDINYIKNRVQKSENISKIYKYYASLCLNGVYSKSYEEVSSIEKMKYDMNLLFVKKKNINFCGEINELSINIKKKFGLFSFFQVCESDNDETVTSNKKSNVFKRHGTNDNPEKDSEVGINPEKPENNNQTENGMFKINKEKNTNKKYLTDDENKKINPVKEQFHVIITDAIYERLSSDDIIMCEVKKNDRKIFIGEYFPCKFTVEDMLCRYIERVVTTDNDYTEYNLFSNGEFKVIEISYTVFGNKRIYHSLKEPKNSKLILKSKSIGLVDIKTDNINNKEILMGLLIKLRELDGNFIYKSMKLYKISENGKNFIYKGFDVNEFVAKRNLK